MIRQENGQQHGFQPRGTDALLALPLPSGRIRAGEEAQKLVRCSHSDYHAQH